MIRHSRLFLVLTSILLASCSHTLLVTGRQSTITGQAVVTQAPGQNSGTLTLVLGGKTYSGRWVYMAGGGSVSLASATAFSGAHSASATGVGFAAPMSGNGSIILSAQDGDTLRCVFDYSQWSKTGIGECEDNHGGTYDLQIM